MTCCLPSHPDRRLWIQRSTALAAGGMLGLPLSDVANAQTTRGAAAAARSPFSIGGSTLAQSVVDAWVKRFGAGQTYQRLGSGGGIEQLKKGALDIAVSDWPLTAVELQQLGAVQIPLCADGLTEAVNLTGVTQIRLPGDSVADLYSNAAASWGRSDIANANPGIKLGGIAAKPIGRSDASGSTRSFSTYLSFASRSWQRNIGSGFVVEWPAHVRRVVGTSGVLQAIRETPGSIGYVGIAEARRAGLVMPSIANAAGAYVAPSTESIQAALNTADWDPRNNQGDVARNTNPAAWPLTVVVYAVLRPSAVGDDAKRFLKSALSSGGADLRQLGFVELPANARTLGDRTLAQLQPSTASA